MTVVADAQGGFSTADPEVGEGLHKLLAEAEYVKKKRKFLIRTSVHDILRLLPDEDVEGLAIQQLSMDAQLNKRRRVAAKDDSPTVTETEKE